MRANIEKYKLIFLILMTVLCAIGYLFFAVRPLHADDLKGIASSTGHVENLILVDDVVYSQEFVCQVDNMSEVSVLFIRENQNYVSGSVSLRLYDEYGLIHEQNYEANIIPNMNRVTNFLDPISDSKGKKYLVEIQASNIGDNDSLGIVVFDDEEYFFSENGERNENAFTITYEGVKNDVTSFWYPTVAIAIMIPLYMTIDYSKIKRKKR